jgi:hypothetical protein
MHVAGRRNMFSGSIVLYSFFFLSSLANGSATYISDQLLQAICMHADDARKVNTQKSRTLKGLGVLTKLSDLIRQLLN